jgi:glyoxylase-like metal-dependent hydrolase (beta-lactamase superfamily II)
MVDPSRLWNGALQVYGQALSTLFGEMIPIPESRVLIRKDSETLDIGSRILTFYDTPGHAKHHFTILDPVSDAVFSGDALGIRYRTCFTNWPFEWIMPSTSPIDFDPEAVQTTVAKLQQLPFQWVYHTHFGRSSKQEALMNTESGALAMAAFMKQFYHPQVTADEVMTGLTEWVHHDLTERGFSASVKDIRQALAMDLPLDALGLMYWIENLKS